MGHGGCASFTDETCPLSTRGRTRRVQLVQGGGGASFTTTLTTSPACPEKVWLTVASSFDLPAPGRTSHSRSSLRPKPIESVNNRISQQGRAAQSRAGDEFAR